MKRYDQWHHLRTVGDKELAARYLPEGRKWLGQVREQLDISGNAQGIIRRTNPDGVSFTARIVGGQPHLTIDVRSAGTTEPNRVLQGIVTKPRDFGTVAANDGQNVFGDFAHNILVSSRAPGARWQTLFFSAAEVPTATPRPQVNGFYKPVFADGLVHHGNIDWKNTDGSLTVNWCGRTTRSIPDLEGYERSMVFHNGAVLFDHSAVGSGVVIGACIRQFAGQTLLLYATAGGGYKFHRVTLAADRAAAPWAADVPTRSAPRLKADPASYALLHTLVGGTDFVASDWLPVVAFNQSANEARLIVPDVLGAVTGLTEVIRYTEFIVDLARPVVPEVTHAVGLTADLDFVYTTSNTARLTPNWVNVAIPGTSGHQSPPVADGTYTLSDASGFSTYYAYPGPGLSSPPWTVVDRSTSSEVRPASVEIPLVVDYQDDVPVYLFYKNPRIERNSAWGIDITDTTTASASGSETWVANARTNWIEHQVATRSMSRVGALGGGKALTIDFAMTGGYVRAVDKDGVEWFRSTIDGEGSGHVTVDVEYDWTGDSNRTSLSTRVDTCAASCTIDQAATSSGRVKQPQLWFVDLRSRSITYTEWDCNDTAASTLAYSGTNNSSAYTGFGSNPEPDTDGTRTAVTGITDESVTARTVVMFEGAVVDDRSTTLGASSPGTTTSGTINVTYVASWVFPNAVNTMVALLQPLSAPLTDGGSGLAGTTADPTMSQEAAAGAWTTPAPGALFDLLQNVSISWTTAHDDPQLFVPPDELHSTPHLHYRPWIATGADKEPTTLELSARNWGTWICHQGVWAYSMPDLASSAPAYRFDLKHAAGATTTLQTLTGDRGAELFEPFWPLSRCAFRR